MASVWELAGVAGAKAIMARLDGLSSSVGPRFAPNAPLKRLAERDGKFYQVYARS